jgi:hypothetical protein
MFYGYARGAQTDRAQLRKALAALEADDVLTMTRLDRLARSTRDLSNTLATIAERKADFRSLGDAQADTTTAHGRPMLTVLGGTGEIRAQVNPHTDRRRPRPHRGRWRKDGTQAEDDAALGQRGATPRRGRRGDARNRAELQRVA